MASCKGGGGLVGWVVLVSTACWLFESLGRCTGLLDHTHNTQRGKLQQLRSDQPGESALRDAGHTHQASIKSVVEGQRDCDGLPSQSAQAV